VFKSFALFIVSFLTDNLVFGNFIITSFFVVVYTWHATFRGVEPVYLKELNTWQSNTGLVVSLSFWVREFKSHPVQMIKMVVECLAEC